MTSDLSYDHEEETHNDSPKKVHAPKRHHRGGKNIKKNHQAAQRRRVEFTSLEQEINVDRESWLEKVSIHLDRILDKADKDHALLRHMDFHYMARNKICKARIRNLKLKLKKEIRKQKRQRELDHFQILVEASLAEHDT